MFTPREYVICTMCMHLYKMCTGTFVLGITTNIYLYTCTSYRPTVTNGMCGGGWLPFYFCLPVFPGRGIVYPSIPHGNRAFLNQSASLSCPTVLLVCLLFLSTYHAGISGGNFKPKACRTNVRTSKIRLYSLRNICHEASQRKCGREFLSRPRNVAFLAEVCKPRGSPPPPMCLDSGLASG
jgi:hypothetical protein